MRCFGREIVWPPASWEETTFETAHYSRVNKKKKIVPNSLLPYSVYLKTLSLNYLSCQQVWVIEKEKDRENEKAGVRLAKINEKKSEKKLDNGGETVAPAVYVVGQQYSCSLCSSLKYTNS